MIKLTITEKAVKEKATRSVKKEIDQHIVKIVDEVNKKTVIYALWSLAGILLITIQFPKPVFYIASVVMTLFVLYFLGEFVLSLKKIIAFINDFDGKLKQIVEQEIQKYKEESVKNKLGLLLSGQSHEDIENFCISYSVRELSHRFKQHKWSILVRITAYTIAILLFKEILFILLS